MFKRVFRMTRRTSNNQRKYTNIACFIYSNLDSRNQSNKHWYCKVIEGAGSIATVDTAAASMA